MRKILAKQFEMSNHLGNVITVVSDRKIPVESTSTPTVIDYYLADVLSTSDYYPGGAIMPGRNFNSSDYRYGFNGMEKDNDISDNNVSYTTFHRIYDSRLAKWFSIDNQSFHKPFVSPYNSMSNNPIVNIDPFGDDDYYNEKGKLIYHTETETDDARFITQKTFNAMKAEALKTKYGPNPTLVQKALFKFQPQIKEIESKSVKIQIQSPEDQEKVINSMEVKTEKNKKESGGFVVFDIKDPKNPKIYIIEDETAERKDNHITLNGSEYFDDDPSTSYVKGSNKTKIIIGDIHTHPQKPCPLEPCYHGPSTPENTADPNGENDLDHSKKRGHAMFVADKSIFTIIDGVIKDLGRKANIAKESIKDYGKRNE